LAWKIELSDTAISELAQLDRPVAKRITDFLMRRVAALDDPRAIGDALQGTALGGYWKYRVGDWRIIAKIEDEAIRIFVVRLGHRRRVYR
jgi:mRNA interferase RelE/StbE